MKKIILSGLLIATMFFNAGCDADEIAAGAIGVAIGIGIGSHSSGHNHHHHRPPRYNRCGRHYCYNANMELNLGGNKKLADFAEKHQISVWAAGEINESFKNVSKYGLNSFARIGLSENDVKVIAKGDMPDSDSIKRMSEKLDLSQAQARDLLKGMLADFDSQANDVNSDYWQSCIAKGEWKTPQNSSCKSTEWSGCGPANGAKLCY